jgi:hypothetical protein
MRYRLDPRPAVAHRHGAIALAAALHRVDRPADFDGMDAVEHADPAGDAMNREAHAVHVEGDCRGERLARRLTAKR